MVVCAKKQHSCTGLFNGSTLKQSSLLMLRGHRLQARCRHRALYFPFIVIVIVSVCNQDNGNFSHPLNGVQSRQKEPPKSASAPPRVERRTPDGRRWKQRWIKLKGRPIMRFADLNLRIYTGGLPEGFHLTHHSYLRALQPDIEDIRFGVLNLHLLVPVYIRLP